MYYHTDEPAMINYLAHVLRTAHTNGSRVRFNIDDRGALSVKVGEGVWTAPFESTPDPYRDLSQTGPVDLKWYVNEDGEPYDYPAQHQREDFPNDFPNAFDSKAEAYAWATSHLFN